MATRQKTGGRAKGTPNKLTTSAKENIACVFVRLGGYEAMTDWARDNQTEFYKIYSKLIPVELIGDEEKPLAIKATLDVSSLSTAALAEILTLKDATNA